MKQSIITLLFLVADMIGMNRLFSFLYAKHRRILMYHGVTSVGMPTTFWTQLNLDKFKTQLEYVTRKCQVVRLTSFLNDDPVAAMADDGKPVAVITFDDGYSNVYSEAWPPLREMSLPVTVFVVTGKRGPDQFIWTDLIYSILIPKYDQEIDLSAFDLGKLPAVDSRSERAEAINNLKVVLKSYPDDERRAVMSYMLEQYPFTDKDQTQVFRLMTGEQIREMADSVDITIASHSHNHPILSTLSPEEQLQDIGSSLDQLAAWGIPETSLFAYPNGRRQDFNEHTVEALRKKGISMAVTTLDGLSSPSEDPFFTKRINIRADINIWEFKARISGLYYFIRKAYKRAKHQKDPADE